MSSLIPEDAKERLQALDAEKSFCVQAPAGSGKTTLLTQRFLKLLGRCQQPEEILAITFTRKAAAEMRNRILASMEQARALENSDLNAPSDHAQRTLELARQALQRDREQGWSLLENTSRLRISTIDGFNAFLAGQLPLMAKLGALPEISENPILLYQEAIMDTLTAELEKGGDSEADAARLLLHVNNNWRGLEELLTALLAKREQWLREVLHIRSHPPDARKILETTLKEVVAEALEALHEALSPYADELLPLLRFAAKNLSSADLEEASGSRSLPAPEIDNFAQWQAVGEMLLTKGNALRKRVSAQNGFPAASSADNDSAAILRRDSKAAMQELLQRMEQDGRLLECLVEFRHAPGARYPDSQWEILASLTRLLPLLVSRLNLAFARHSKADYNHISSAALEALGPEERPTDLALRLDYRISHILVDEFQDTSFSQIELLEKLTRGWQPGDGRTLFIVGDGMQSCYGFRNANVGLFLAARDSGIGTVALEPLQLKANFRSQKAVVAWVNEVFQEAFPERDDISHGGVSYSPAAAVHDGDLQAGVSACLLSASPDLPQAKDIQKTAQAERAVSYIQEFQSRHPDDNIAVLVRSRPDLRFLVPQLRAHKVPWNAVEIDSLGAYPFIRDLLMLSRALLNPADAAAWLAILRAPWFGLPLRDIHALSLRARHENRSLWQAMENPAALESLSQDAKAILQRCIPVLQLARSERQRLPLREWVEGAWIMLGGPACLEDVSSYRNVEHFFSVLESHDAGGDVVDIHRFQQDVETAFGDGAGEDCKLQIMTIHKAKGLEFDRVIIPFLDAGTQSDGNPLLLWRKHVARQGRRGLIISPRRETGGEPDQNYQYLKREAARHRELEDARLLYIAVTRAIKQAVLIGGVQPAASQSAPKEGSAGKSLWAAPRKGSLLATIWKPLENKLGDDDFVQILPDSQATADKTAAIPAGDAPGLERGEDGTGGAGDAPELEQSEDAPGGAGKIPGLEQGEDGTGGAGKTPTAEKILSRRLPPQWHAAHFPAPQPLPETSEEEKWKTPQVPLPYSLEAKKIGDLIHDCLRQAGQGQLDLASDQELQQREGYWRLQLRPVAKNVAKAVAAIHRQLRQCAGHEKYHWLLRQRHQQAGCEVALRDYRQGQPRKYIIDRTFVDAAGKRWIIDYKTSSPAKGEALEAFLARQEELYRPQLQQYADCCRCQENRPVKMALFFTALPHFHEIS